MEAAAATAKKAVNSAAMESEKATSKKGERDKFGYLPIPAIEATDHWEEIEELLMEASADGLTKLHKLVHSVMKQRNLEIPIIGGK